eukprot:3464995-Pyramimonas_sp.AAC.1
MVAISWATAFQLVAQSSSTRETKSSTYAGPHTSFLTWGDSGSTKILCWGAIGVVCWSLAREARRLLMFTWIGEKSILNR